MKRTKIDSQIVIQNLFISEDFDWIYVQQNLLHQYYKK